ncbi:MAG: thioredoxin family protein [Pirellulales bacterium]
MNAWAALLLGFAISGEPEVVLYDFRSDACGPCRAMDPIVAELRSAGAPIRVVDVQRDPETAKKFGITEIPCFVAVADGREVGRRSGPQTREDLVAMLRGEKTLGTAAPSREGRRTNAPIQLVAERTTKPRLSADAKMIDLETPRAPSTDPFRAVGPADPRIAGRDRAETPPRNDAGNANDAFRTLRDDLLQSSVRLLIVDDKGLRVRFGHDRRFASGRSVDSDLRSHLSRMERSDQDSRRLFRT